MHANVEPFDNRQHAGAELARALEGYRSSDAIVLAIPRGGVVVGYEVASQLGLEMDVIVPRKIPAPQQEELAIGAVASWGDHERIIDDHAVRFLGVSADYIDREVERQLAEVNRRLLAYRGTVEPPSVAGRNVLLVDDGIATGYTTRAAAIALRNLKASRVVLAVPVGPPDSVRAIRPYVDELVCLRMPTPFMAVGYWYRDFAQVSDAEVIDLLERIRAL
jgi:putative phosphoribosyl transferase